MLWLPLWQYPFCSQSMVPYDIELGTLFYSRLFFFLFTSLVLRWCVFRFEEGGWLFIFFIALWIWYGAIPLPQSPPSPPTAAHMFSLTRAMLIWYFVSSHLFVNWFEWLLSINNTLHATVVVTCATADPTQMTLNHFLPKISHTQLSSCQCHLCRGMHTHTHISSMHFLWALRWLVASLPAFKQRGFIRSNLTTTATTTTTKEVGTNFFGFMYRNFLRKCKKTNQRMIWCGTSLHFKIHPWTRWRHNNIQQRAYKKNNRA